MYNTIKVKAETVETYKGKMEKITIRAYNPERPRYQLYGEIKKYKNGNWFGFLEAGNETDDYGWQVQYVVCPDEDEIFNDWRYITSRTAKDFAQSLAAILIETCVNTTLNDFPYAGIREFIHLSADILTDTLCY